MAVAITTNLANKELWEKFWADRDSAKSVESLVTCMMPLVLNVMRRIAIRLPQHIDTQDLVQAGIIGLCDAIDRYDVSLNTAFEPFASIRIKGAIIDELRKNDVVPRSMRAKQKKIEAALGDFTEKNNAPPTETELALIVDMTVDEVSSILASTASMISLDNIAYTDESGRSVFLKDILKDTAVKTPDRDAEKSDVTLLMRKSFKGLSDREQKVLYLYYYEDLNLAEIALLFEITEARICQIHALAVAKMRACLLKSGCTCHYND